jgi:hypothetical protein
MSGEREGRREQMDRFVSNMVRSGGDPEYAKRKARECAVRADRRDDKKRREPKTK